MLKIPPPLIVLILIFSNFLSSKKVDVILIPNQILVSILILLIGILILVFPVSKFIKSKTSIDPIKFKKVNKLVTSGIYKYSRNATRMKDMPGSFLSLQCLQSMS